MSPPPTAPKLSALPRNITHRSQNLRPPIYTEIWTPPSFGTAGSAVYAASKAALNLLTKSWAAEYGPRGVRVNAVAPGPTATDNALMQFGEDGLAAMMRHTPARRVAAPTEIAEAVAYLASDQASFVHGAVIPVDGGRTAV
ncbi:SDR family oxidoreductase [Mycolicibacter arupensis]|nr:SDR family oxidoreductase [Mycolicibacter arupensis]